MDGSQRALFWAEEVFIFQLVYMTSLRILPYNPLTNLGLHCNNVEHLRLCFFLPLSLLPPAIVTGSSQTSFKVIPFKPSVKNGYLWSCAHALSLSRVFVSFCKKGTFPLTLL